MGVDFSKLQEMFALSLDDALINVKSVLDKDSEVLSRVESDEEEQ